METGTASDATSGETSDAVPVAAAEVPAGSRPWAGVVALVRRHPGLVTCAVLCAAYFAFVWASALLLQLNSDKVWVQTVLALRGRYGSAHIESSGDNYLLKAPLYLAANHLFGMTLRAVRAEVVAENLVLFVSIALAYALLRRTRVVHPAPWPLVALVGLWTISVCDPTGPLHSPVAQPTVTLIHPNERNAELGLAILILVVAGLLDAGRIGTALRIVPRIAATTGLALATGAVCFDDPYNLYLMLPPFAAIAVLRAARAARWRELVSRQAVLLWYFIGASALVYLVARKLAAHIGLHLYPEGQRFGPASELWTAVTGAFTSLIAMYDGSFFDERVGSIATVRLVLNAVLAVAVAAYTLTLLARWHRPENSARLLLPLAVLAITASFVLSGSATIAAHVRYLIAVVPVFLLLAPGALAALSQSERGRIVARVVCGLLVLSTLLNAAHVARSTRSALSGPGVNRQLYARTATLAELGIGKGYATYWNANVTTYVSRGAQLTIPVRCRGGRVRVDYWLMDTSWLRKPAVQSYLVREPHDPMLLGCSPARLVEQFGRPARTVPLPGGGDVLLYDYDILSRMPPRPSPSSR